jgi:TolA-binding protein
LRAWIVRAVREWPLGIAVAAILSLAFLPRLLHLGPPPGPSEPRDLDDLRREVQTGDPAIAESRLEAFLARSPGGPEAAEARLLLARAILARARAGDFPGAAGFRRAWAILSKEPRTPETLALRRDAAALPAEVGLLRDAVDRFRELADETSDPDVALDLASALVKLAAAEPAIRHALLDEASARVSEFRRVAPPERRVRGVLAQARIYRESRRDEDLLRFLVAELADAKLPADRGLLQLERGRALARMGREMEAMVCFDEAEKLLADPYGRGLAMVHQAQLYVRASNPEAVEVGHRLTASGSPAAPLGTIVSALLDLRARPAAALDQMRNGFARVRRPRELDDVDFPWIYDALQAAAARETDPEILARVAAVLAEIGRLRPLSTRVGYDHASVLRRARKFEEAADRLLAMERSERSVLEAADACAEGGLHLRAAALYRTYADLQPAANTAGLYLRALSLKKAGDAEGAAAGFEEYVAAAGPSGKFSGAALLEKAELQKSEDALATYDRILKAREVTTSPAQEEWARALLGRGRALLDLSRVADARKVLSEYLERYAEGSAPRPGAVEASWLLVRVAIEERQWKAGLEQVRRLADLAARFPEASRASFAGTLSEARFAEADLKFNLDDYAGSAQAYAEATRRASEPEDRLRGMIGRARALSRLERKDEARRDYSNARAFFDQDKAFAGRGREYWEIALEGIARELR